MRPSSGTGFSILPSLWISDCLRSDVFGVEYLGHEMKKKTKVIDFPKIAEPNIDAVFAEFLKDQQDRLKLKSYQRYEEVIDLFRHCLNGSGYHELDDSSEVILYERLYFQKNHESA